LADISREATKNDSRSVEFGIQQDMRTEQPLVPDKYAPIQDPSAAKHTYIQFYDPVAQTAKLFRQSRSQWPPDCGLAFQVSTRSGVETLPPPDWRPSASWSNRNADSGNSYG